MTTKIFVKTTKKPRKLNRYAGEWVAFLGTEIVAHSKSLKELMNEIDSMGLREKISVFLVPRKDEGPYILVIL